jgi:hypothetical protein
MHKAEIRTTIAWAFGPIVAEWAYLACAINQEPQLHSSASRFANDPGGHQVLYFVAFHGCVPFHKTARFGRALVRPHIKLQQRPST